MANATRGLIALSFGDPQKALNYELSALELANSRNDKKDEATIYKNIGMIQRAQGRDDLALSSFEQAAEIDSTIGSRRGLAYDLRNIASIYISTGVNSPSRRQLEQSLQVSLEINDWRNAIQCYLELGRLELLDKRPDSARVDFNKAAEMAEQFYMPDIQWRAHKYLAQTWTILNDAVKTTEQYYRAIDVIESMRSMIRVEEYASGFVDDKLDVYGALIDLLLQRGEVNEAFNLVERSKSRNFLDMLGSRDISFNTQNSDLLAKGDSLETRIKEQQTRLFYLRSRQDSVLISDIEQLEAGILSTREQYDNLLVSIRDAEPELSDMLSVNPWTVEQVQQHLSPGTGLLEFYLYDRYLYSWFVTADKISYSRQEAPRDHLSAEIFDLREALDRQLSITRWSQSLYDLLIKPWESSIEQVKHIVLVPQGSLHYLPFAVLQDKQAEYLGFKRSLSVSPSATVMGYCLAKGDSLLTTERQNMPVLALGDPDLGSKQWDLPFAAREVNSLSRYYPDVDILLSQRASETNLYNQPVFPPLMLFSCHGAYDDANPLLSALLLSPDSTNDGRLEAREIFGLNMNAFVVAMSACETGLGTIRGGDEVIGLSRSFIYAGASSLLTSLWKVDDLATAVLMKRFFRYLAEGKTRSEALLLAQKMVHDEINPYPSFWGAFTLTGDYR